ncbi:lysophospholipid acyltransferase family protein [Desulfatibacillum aliphaticivorans]|uniref:Phospholipid/glycerol acyltransferase n=1 Tax=Desulfatibacillum aliphaticivorans TaxID=218208 RepID=B8F9Z5_DESAL|nr:lysophospholipid acyltransferase family protein [Desulfatibacillum aliphaticivorans]ACL03091.1 phospholipid/glycerol acyltransferase [Desulfatibacillum aliphaticivorans]
MHYTMFDTPILRTIFRWISVSGLWAFGWKTEGDPPESPKYVLIAAPHTSNWDLLATLCIAFKYRIKIYWMGKDSLFRFPMGPVLKWLGGIPVVRSRSTNMVERAAAEFSNHDQLVLVIPPEGTRGKVRWWKTGFYYIAHTAKVPIVMGFVDFGRKVGGLGPEFIPTGDIDKDMEEIKAFYKNIKGKRQALFSDQSVSLQRSQKEEIHFKTEEESDVKKAV